MHQPNQSKWWIDLFKHLTVNTNCWSDCLTMLTDQCGRRIVLSIGMVMTSGLPYAPFFSNVLFRLPSGGLEGFHECGFCPSFIKMLTLNTKISCFNLLNTIPKYRFSTIIVIVSVTIYVQHSVVYCHAFFTKVICCKSHICYENASECNISRIHALWKQSKHLLCTSHRNSSQPSSFSFIQIR